MVVRMTSYPMGYVMPLTELDEDGAVFSMDEVGIALAIPVKDWITLGRPGQVRVDVNTIPLEEA